jgi:hypothetical protein
MSFSDETIRAVWQKGTQTTNAKWKKDQCTAWIKWDDYGNRDSEYGWEIDHITPVADGGKDDLSNLRPLHWKNNARTSDGRLSCAVKSSGSSNGGA